MYAVKAASCSGVSSTRVIRRAKVVPFVVFPVGLAGRGYSLCESAQSATSRVEANGMRLTITPRPRINSDPS